MNCILLSSSLRPFFLLVLQGGNGFGNQPQQPEQPQQPPIGIVSYENNPNNGDGSYSWSYETGNC